MFADLREGHHCPNSRMSVLATVFAHARDIAFDITWVEMRFGKRRIEQLDEPRIPAHEPLIDGFHCLTSAVRSTGAGKDRPALGQRIDLALGICPGTQGFAVVKISASIPLAVPGSFFDLPPELFCLSDTAIGE